MKKTKIIVPALSLILLSTVASISGTVAWFTASRSVEVSTSTFAVTKLDGDLDAVMTAGAGTQVKAGSNDKTIEMKTYDSSKYYTLTDASYNKESTMLYTKTLGSDDTVNGHKEIANLAAAESTNAWLVNDVVHAYYAASWTITFTNKGGSSTTSSLFFNLKESTAASDATSSEGLKTEKSFRLAFICGDKKMTWAPKRASDDGYTPKHVTGTELSNVLDEPNIVYTNTTSELAVEEASSVHTARTDYLGTFTKTGAEDPTLEVKCVAWFEGTDPTCVNEAELNKISTSLKFYTRNQL